MRGFSIRELMERHPDDWYRRRNPRQYAESVTAAAQFLGADPANMLLVENVTTGKSCNPTYMALLSVSFVIFQGKPTSMVLVETPRPACVT